MTFVLTLILCTLSSYVLYYIFTIIGGKTVEKMAAKLQKGLFDQTLDFLNISDLHVHRTDLKLGASIGNCSQRYIHNCLYASGKSALYMHCTSNWLLPSMQLIPWRHTPCPLSKNRALQRFTVTDSKWLMEESARMRKCFRVNELCNLLQLRQTALGQTGCQDNDPSLCEAPGLREGRGLWSLLQSQSICAHICLV